MLIQKNQVAGHQSNEYPQYMFSRRNKKTINTVCLQENIDAKHQYAGKLICHALLSSL